MPSVLVTGAARGIGRAIALRLAAGGWDVVAGVRRELDREALTAAGGDRISPVLLDVTEADQVAALSSVLPARLDAVVNNAGIVVGGPVEAVAVDELRRQLDVNVVGQVAVAQAVLPRLRASRGRVVFVSSLSGRVATADDRGLQRLEVRFGGPGRRLAHGGRAVADTGRERPALWIAIEGEYLLADDLVGGAAIFGDVELPADLSVLADRPGRTAGTPEDAGDCP